MNLGKVHDLHDSAPAARTGQILRGAFRRGDFTCRRTIREADLVNFISVTGMLEEIFIDETHCGAMSAGAVPGALT